MEAVKEALTAPELQKAMQALITIRATDGSDIAQLGDPSYVARRLFELSKNGQVVKFYKDDIFVGLMAFDIGQLWWLEKPLLIEQLVLACDKNVAGIQREAIRALEALAKYTYPFVVGIASGSLFLRQPGIVMNAYKRAGFTQAAPTAIKVLEGGDGNGEG